MKTAYLRELLQYSHLPCAPSVKTYKPASVLMPLFEKNTEAYLLAVRKADTEGYPWRNQIAFPGGQVDESDKSAMAAAYREIKEELNIDESRIDMIGSLGYFQTIREMEIEAFVGFWEGDHAGLHFDPQEISATLEICLEDLVKTHVHSNYMGRRPDVYTLVYPVGSASACGDIVIWGVTAMIVHFFLEHLRQIAPEMFDLLPKKRSSL